MTIHGQAGQWHLKSTAKQREILDGFAPAKHRKLLADYGAQWEETERLRAQLAQLEQGRDQREAELLFLRQVLAEAEGMEIEADEDEVLSAAIDRLTNVEHLRQAAYGALGQLADTALDALGSAADTLTRAAADDPALQEFARRAASVEVEAAELSSDLREYAETLFDDPQELARLHARRAALTDMMRGRAASVPEFLTWLKNAEDRVQELGSAQQDPALLQEELDQATAALAELMQALTASRKRAAKKLGAAVSAELGDLALKGARLIVEVTEATPAAHGADRVEMLLQPHPDAPPSPLSQGASGGELSRVMLALEVVLAHESEQRTFVFDEIDAGIGGTTAAVIASRLAKLAETHQVIVVTHLAQVAAAASTNFVVTKAGSKATIARVEGDGKTEELVRMLGGETEDGAARRLALQLESAAAVAQSAV